MNGIIGMLTLLEETLLNNEQKDYMEMMIENVVFWTIFLQSVADYNLIKKARLNGCKVKGTIKRALK